MTGIANNFINSLLADATYVNVTASMDRDRVIEALRPRMTSTQAEFIATNFGGELGVRSCLLPTNWGSTNWGSGLAFCPRACAGAKGKT